jgi:hypothetical protein
LRRGFLSKTASIYTHRANRAKLEAGAAHKLHRAEPNPAHGRNKAGALLGKIGPDLAVVQKIRAY